MMHSICYLFFYLLENSYNWKGCYQKLAYRKNIRQEKKLKKGYDFVEIDKPRNLVEKSQYRNR